MFSALNQGSLIYILDKTEKPKLKIGIIVAISQPKVSYNIQNQQVIDIKCQVDGATYDYNGIPSSSSIVSYNNGKITLSETKQGLQTEVESLLQNSKQIVDNIQQYKQNIIECEGILKELSPQFAKDKARDERLDNLESKIDQLINLINKKNYDSNRDE